MIDVCELLEKVRKEKPVIHHITNWVTIYDCANIVKVFGASPVMAHAIEEAADMSSLAGALVLNIGTLTTEIVEAMKKAAKVANSRGIPIVLDVCGAGATAFRDEKSFELLSETRIDIIKGNASEVSKVAGLAVKTKGVDAGSVDGNLRDIAKNLAKEKKCTVVITGAEDIVSDGKNNYTVKNGVPMMANIVGTGCMAASVIGTFAAVCGKKDLAKAAAAGLCSFEIACEIASLSSKGAGSFKMNVYDAVSNLTAKDVRERQKIV